MMRSVRLSTSFLRNAKVNHRNYNSSIEVSNLVYNLTSEKKPKVDPEKLIFGTTFTDHMLEVDYDKEKGWHNPIIKPYQNLSISPASSALHYGIECFEGMKAYKDEKGSVRLFRPDKNMARLESSMLRLGMPAPNGVLDALKALVEVDSDWIPQLEGYSLYIRPTAIGTSPYLGVKASDHFKLFIILSPSGPYFKSGFVPIKLLADTVNVRAWPGGVGDVKVGGNYAPTIQPLDDVSKRGYSNILWLFGPQHEVTEVGAMNIFFVMKKQDNSGLELVTAPLSRGDILPGVTRDSILHIANTLSEEDKLKIGQMNLEVCERFVTMPEIVSAAKEGRLMESFGAGTAVVVSPVNCIHYNGSDIDIPTGDVAGPVTKLMWDKLYEIQYGKVDHPWSVLL